MQKRNLLTIHYILTKKIIRVTVIWKHPRGVKRTRLRLVFQPTSRCPNTRMKHCSVFDILHETLLVVLDILLILPFCKKYTCYIHVCAQAALVFSLVV